MKIFSSIFLFFIACSIVGFSQPQYDGRKAFYELEWENKKTDGLDETLLISDSNIDIKFYHLDIKIALDSQFISGNVYIELQPTVNNLNYVKLNLHPSMTVDSVTLDAVSVTVDYDTILLNLAENFNIGDIVKMKIYYHGVPVQVNGIKGLRYAVHGMNEPIITSLSTPFLSHYWWPCKDGTEDKADSVYVDITIKDTTINGIPLTAVSNGILDCVDSSSVNCKTFKWRHRYPIVPYYIMAAISNYKTIEQHYTGINSKFPLTYYVFDYFFQQSLDGVAQLPKVFDIFAE